MKLTESTLRKIIKQELKEAVDLPSSHSKIYKVVYNSGYGGFQLSKMAIAKLKELGVEDVDKLKRHDPRLVQVVEELGEKASGSYSELMVKKIKSPLYKIDEYDGAESVITPDNMEWIKIE